MWANETTQEWDKDFIQLLLEWLGYDGMAFFEMCMQEYDELAPVWVEGQHIAGIGDTMQLPHPVHFREGMQVRNAMRRIHTQLGVKLYDAHFYDDFWQSAVSAVLKQCEEGYNGHTDEP